MLSSSKMSDKHQKKATRTLSVMVNLRNPVGRKSHYVWNNFSTERDPKTNKVTSNICNQCFKQISAQPCRMQKHINKCKGQQGVVLVAPESQIPVPKKPKIIATESLTVNESASVSCIEIPTCKTTKKTKDSLDISLGRLIFGLNLPFNLIDHHLFNQFVKRLRPTYQLPSKDLFTTSILEQVYEESIAAKAFELKGKKVTIWQDGCSTVKPESIISHYLSTGNKTFFIDAVPTSIEPNTAIYCLNLMEICIDKAEEDLGCKVIAAVTDNCEVNNSICWHLQVKRPDMFVYCCHAHLLYLLGQELMVVDVMDDIVAVQKHFRDHQFEHDALLELRGSTPNLPTTTAWDNQLDCLRSFLENHSKYIEISCLPNPNVLKDDHVMSTISDGNLYTTVVQCVKKLEPIAMSLDKIRRGTAILPDAVHEWITLEETKDLASDSAFQSRKQSALTPVAIASYLLHPIYRGKGLTTEQDSLGYDFLESRNPMFVAAAINLQQSNSSFFPSSHLNLAVIQHLTPTVWWRSLEKFNSISGDLVDFGESLMSLPASIIDVEQHASNIEDIFNKNYQQLGIDKVQKLISVYHSFATDVKYKEQQV